MQYVPDQGWNRQTRHQVRRVLMQARHAGSLVWPQVDDSAFDANEALMERLLAVDDVDAVHTNCAGLA